MENVAEQNNIAAESVLTKHQYFLKWRLRRRWFMFFLLILGTPYSQLIPFGAAIVLFSQIIIIWSYGILQRHQTLTTEGPYALSRNPVYTSVILASVGFYLMAGAGASPAYFSFLPFLICIAENIYLNPLMIVIAIYFFSSFIYHSINRIEREEKNLSSTFGKDYTSYCERVPTRFLPHLPSIVRTDWLLFTFSTEIALRNQVFTRALKIMVWLLLFIAKDVYLRDLSKGRYYQVWQHRDFLLFVVIFIMLLLLRLLARRLQRKFEPFRNL